LVFYQVEKSESIHDIDFAQLPMTIVAKHWLQTDDANVLMPLSESTSLSKFPH
jgi:hypothetical protein